MSVVRNLNRFIVLLIASVFLLSTLSASAAQAAMIGTDVFAGSEQVESQRQSILDMLDREQVREQLVTWGVDPVNAEQRVGSMTASEVQVMHDRMQQMPAGAGGGSVVSAFLIVFLVLLITDILGYTNVFPFTTSHAH